MLRAWNADGTGGVGTTRRPEELDESDLGSRDHPSGVTGNALRRGPLLGLRSASLAEAICCNKAARSFKRSVEGYDTISK